MELSVSTGRMAATTNKLFPQDAGYPVGAPFHGFIKLILHCLVYVFCVWTSGVFATGTLRLGVGPLYDLGPEGFAVVVEAPVDLSKQGAQDFTLLSGGNPAGTAFARKSFAQSGENMAWLLSVDVRSLAGWLRETKAALDGFVTGSRSVHFGLMTAGDAIRLIQPVAGSGETQAVVRAIGRLAVEPSGSDVGLERVLSVALDELAQTQEQVPARRRILVLWGSKDEISAARFDELAERAEASQVPIDLVALGTLDARFRDRLRDLAGRTGGRYVYAQANVVSPSDALSLIHRQVLETHAAVVYFNQPLQTFAGQELGIEVRLPGALTLKGFLRVKSPVPGPLEETKGPAEAEDASVPEARGEHVDEAQPEEAGASETARQEEKRKQLYRVLAVCIAAILAAVIVLVGRRILMAKARQTGAGVQVAGTPKVRPTPPIPTPVPEKTRPYRPPEPQRLTTVGGNFPPPGESGTPVILDGIGGVVRGQRFDMRADVFRIGAAPDNDLAISGDDYVSAQHAYLRYDKGSLFILDLGSRNGTFVNGERVSGTAHVLIPGDQITMGGCTFTVGFPPPA